MLDLCSPINLESGFGFGVDPGWRRNATWDLVKAKLWLAMGYGCFGSLNWCKGKNNSDEAQNLGELYSWVNKTIGGMDPILFVLFWAQINTKLMVWNA